MRPSSRRRWPGWVTSVAATAIRTITGGGPDVRRHPAGDLIEPRSGEQPCGAGAVAGWAAEARSSGPPADRSAARRIVVIEGRGDDDIRWMCWSTGLWFVFVVWAIALNLCREDGSTTTDALIDRLLSVSRARRRSR